MRKHQNTFSHGLNQDISTNKYPNTNFYWAQNFRLVSKDGLATGALTNVNGTVPKLSMGAGLNIIGTTLIRDTLVLFVASDDGGKIYIWKHNSNDFEESPTLIYSDPNLNFSTERPVRAVGRYETENIQKVYFTDGETFFKFLNIIPQEGESYPLSNHRLVDSLDLIPDVTFSDISLELVSGGSLKAGKIQYAYQLYSKRGSESVFSPASQLVHITEADETQNSFNYYGSEVGTSVNKAVSISLNNPDNLFTRIRIVAIEYTVLYQIPKVRIVGEYNIEDLTELTVVDSGESIGELTLEEFRFIQNDFYPKTIDVKNDLLFAGNIKNNYFEIADSEFDARSFRANAYDLINVYNGNNPVMIPHTGGSFDSETLPDIDKEQFNSFNDLANDYNANNVGIEGLGALVQYKYKPGSAGTVLGGKGPNIEYEFTTEEVILDDSPRSNDFGEGYPRLKIGSSAVYDNNASPLSKIGYQRDEIYRFGIVFFDTKGRQSFVKWIGDIRFPSNRDSDTNGDYGYIYYDSVNNRTMARILGIKFTVNIPEEVKNKISGYQIVRADRTNKDKTIISQGITAHPIYTGIGIGADEDHMYTLATTPTVKDVFFKYTATSRQTENFYSGTNQVSGIDDYEFNNSDIKLKTNWLEFNSPDVVINKPTLPLSEAYLDIFGMQDEVETLGLASERGFEDSDSGNDNEHDILVADKPRNFVFETDGYKIKVPINYQKIFSPKSRGNVDGGPEHDATKTTLEGGQIYNNQTYAPSADTNAGNNYTQKSKWGLRGTYALLKTDQELPSLYNWVDGDNIRFLMANYKVDKGRSIYGGSSYEARTSTRYYPASEFLNKNITEIDVFKGDTYISYFSYIRSIYDYERANGYRIETYMFYPVESTLNLNLRIDQIQDYINWGFYRDAGVTDYKLTELVSDGVLKYGTNYPIDVGNLYRYNPVYSAIDKSKEFYSEPFDFDYTLINDTRITASEKKINSEYIDSWTKFKFANYIDVDSKHNSITKLITFKNNLFFVQPTAIGIASVNDRSLIQDNQPGQLSLGTGGVLPRYDYITDKSGSAFYEAILASDDFLFYADGRRKRINKIVPGKEVAVSVVKGIDSTLDKLTWKNVRAGFDRGYNEVIFAIDNTTLAFNETADAFVSSYTFNPGIMFSIGEDFFSTGTLEDESPWLYSDLPIDVVGYSDNADEDYILIGPGGSSETLFKHDAGEPGEFYGGDGGAADSYLTLIINPMGNQVCFFDNLDLRTESTNNGVDDPDDIFYRMEASNNYQNITRELSFAMNQSSGHTGTVKRLGRVWRTPIMATPPSGSSYSRMLDTYLKVTLRYENNGNTFRVHDVQTYYRPANH